MAFDIKAYNSINFLNELEQFINDFDKSGINENPNHDSIDYKILDYNIDEKFKDKNKVERYLVIDESQELNVKHNTNLKEKENDQMNELPKCPYCLLYVIIEGGCNFITCDSLLCQGRKFFCKICNKKLLLSDKITHFPQGMFNNSCKNDY
jgi:hypothetical protein